MKIGHPKDFWGGVLFALIGLAFAVIARGVPGLDFTIGSITVALPGYSMGTPARMGPAFFPFYLGVMLLVLGVIIAVGGFRKASVGEDAEFPTYHWRPILFVLGAVIMFGLILKSAGMLISGLLLVIVSSMGNPEKFHTRDVLILGVVLVVFCALVFVWGLKLPIPLCPDIESLQNALKFCRG